MKYDGSDILQQNVDRIKNAPQLTVGGKPTDDELNYDPIKKPLHYNCSEIETFDYIKAVLGDYDTIHYCHGTLHKYIGTRLWTKDDPIDNARKAQWFLDKMIELMKVTKGTHW